MTHLQCAAKNCWMPSWAIYLNTNSMLTGDIQINGISVQDMFKVPFGLLSVSDAALWTASIQTRVQPVFVL